MSWSITKAVYNVTEYLEDTILYFKFEGKWSTITNKCFNINVLVF